MTTPLTLAEWAALTGRESADRHPLPMWIDGSLATLISEPITPSHTVVTILDSEPEPVAKGPMVRE